MHETPNHRPPRDPIDGPDAAVDPAGEVAPSRRRAGLWLAAVLTVLGLVAVALFAMSRGPSREEQNAIQAAVAGYAELYREPPGRIYRYGKIRAEKQADAAWRVSITRIVVPDGASDYGITSIFRVDRDGTCVYVGQKVGREH